MNEFLIDCTPMEDPRQLHQAIARALSFPDYYGNNLDALHDCLTEIGQPTCLRIRKIDELGIFAGMFCRVLEDSQEENPNFQVIFE